MFLYDGTTYVPVRAVCEAAGMDVSFDSKTRTVELTTPDWNLSEDPDASEYITRSKAKEIALDDAGVKSSDAVFLKAELDWDDGVAHYDVEFYSKGVEYDYEINAKTGKIIESDRDVDGYDAPDWDDYWDDWYDDDDNNTSSGSVIGSEKAQQIARNKAGSGATVVKCQLDWDDGRQVYEIEWYANGAKYDYEIEVATGEVIKSGYEVKNSPDIGNGVTTDEETAKQTALARVSGATEKDIYEWKLDYDDNRPEYEGKIIYGNMEYEFTIDANTGEILEWDMDSVYD